MVSATISNKRPQRAAAIEMPNPVSASNHKRQLGIARDEPPQSPLTATRGISSFFAEPVVRSDYRRLSDLC